MRNVFIVSILSGFLFSGCIGLSPELIREMATDSASFCMRSDIRGGVGTIVSPSGGYGQGTIAFCRSDKPNATMSISPDGAISITNGKKEVESAE